MSRQWIVEDEHGNKVKSAEAQSMPKWLIHPFHPYFRIFLYLTVFMAGMTGLVTPFVVAFQSSPGLWCDFVHPDPAFCLTGLCHRSSISSRVHAVP